MNKLSLSNNAFPDWALGVVMPKEVLMGAIKLPFPDDPKNPDMMYAGCFLRTAEVLLRSVEFMMIHGDSKQLDVLIEFGAKLEESPNMDMIRMSPTQILCHQQDE